MCVGKLTIWANIASWGTMRNLEDISHFQGKMGLVAVALTQAVLAVDTCISWAPPLPYHKWPPQKAYLPPLLVAPVAQVGLLDVKRWFHQTACPVDLTREWTRKQGKKKIQETKKTTIDMRVNGQCWPKSTKGHLCLQNDSAFIFPAGSSLHHSPPVCPLLCMGSRGQAQGSCQDCRLCVHVLPWHAPPLLCGKSVKANNSLAITAAKAMQ